VSQNFIILVGHGKSSSLCTFAVFSIITRWWLA
jgi:hypothetical protein